MQYRHSFHAGNFADVHKHVALLQLMQALQKKAKGFLYLDTHAGEGLYDLGGADARHSGECAGGIQQLEQALAHVPQVHPAIRGYIEAIQRIRRSPGTSGHAYPGSPLLAALLLREVDRACCVESQAQVARALQRHLEHHAALLATQPRVIVGGDGYRELKGQLPPQLRRGLILIDPPYESQDEEQHLAAALAEGLMRFETGVFAIWYPIKRQYDTDLWLARILRGITRPTLAIELCLTPPDNTAGLHGSGMLVVNPPWQFDEDARQWQPQLHELLGGKGGTSVRWLVHE